MRVFCQRNRLIAFIIYMRHGVVRERMKLIIFSILTYWRLEISNFRILVGILFLLSLLLCEGFLRSLTIIILRYIFPLSPSIFLPNHFIFILKHLCYAFRLKCLQILGWRHINRRKRILVVFMFASNHSF